MHVDFEQFEVDSMTDTMLRHSYRQIVKNLDPIVQWLYFAPIILKQDYS